MSTISDKNEKIPPEKQNPPLLKVNYHLLIDALEQYRLIDVTCPHCHQTRQVRKGEFRVLTCNECFIDYPNKKYLKFREYLYFGAELSNLLDKMQN